MPRNEIPRSARNDRKAASRIVVIPSRRRGISNIISGRFNFIVLTHLQLLQFTRLLLGDERVNKRLDVAIKDALNIV